MNAAYEVYGTMLDPKLAEERLKEKGAHMTAQRRAVLEVLFDNRTHPTAEEVMQSVRERLGCVSAATVYNTLESLKELGFVRRIEGLEQKAHFDPDTSNHQHIICRKCKRVWDIESPRSLPEVPDGFVIEDVLIQGTCAHCAAG